MTHTHCRVCRTPLPDPFLDLGEQPLANALRDPLDNTPEFKAPLAVTRCVVCGLSQLTVVISPDVLYSGYRFRSGESEKWRRHCRALAERFETPTGKILDIACNDGALLDEFRRFGWICVGVDLAPATDAAGIFTGYWDKAMARWVKARYGEFDLVVAQNVVGHVDDPVTFLTLAKSMLSDTGVIAVEVPDADVMLGRGEFDTIYHEHLSYWTAGAMHVAAAKAGLSVFHSEQFREIHGGTIRFWLQPARDVAEFPARVARILTDTANLLSAQTGRVMAYGASAKAAVMLNALSNTFMCPMPTAVIDDCVEKQGFHMPGVGIPVIACPDLSKVDVLWLTSWNNAEGLKEKARAKGFKGKFLTTVPTVRLE